MISGEGSSCFTIVPYKTKINQDSYQKMIEQHVAPRLKAWGTPKGSYKSAESMHMSAEKMAEIAVEHGIPDSLHCPPEENAAPQLEPKLSQLGAIFQQDGASSHTAHQTIDYLGKLGICVLKNWPPLSPDLNPIETIWAWMKYELRQNPPKNLADLQDRIEFSVWHKVCTPDRCQKLYSRYRKRLLDVIESGGCRISG